MLFSFRLVLALLYKFEAVVNIFFYNVYIDIPQNSGIILPNQTAALP